jgi:hypothetical protein
MSGLFFSVSHASQAYSRAAPPKETAKMGRDCEGREQGTPRNEGKQMGYVISQITRFQRLSTLLLA